MFGFGKSKKSDVKQQKVDRKTLMTTIDSAMDNWMEADSTDALLEETGKTRQELLDAVLADDEVESCREDIRTAILAESWRIWGEDVPEEMINELYKNIRRLQRDFAELAILSKFGGYAVAEYVFKPQPNGFITLEAVLSKAGELDKYTPRRHGGLTLNLDGEDVLLNTKVKYLLLTSKAVPAKPMGELMVIRAYPAVAMRKRGWAYAGQFIARYAQPYVVGKQGGFSSTGLSDFVSKVFAFLSGGAIGIGKEDEIDIHQLNGDGEAFERLERLANRRIQKLLLGRVKNSELTSGSRAAQQTDDESRQDRVSAYLDLMTGAMQHAIDAIYLVNQHYGTPIHAPKGLWFEYEQQFQPDKVRAEVDQIYMATGTVQRTAAYYTDMLGWEASHFEVIDPASRPSSMMQPRPLSLSQPVKPTLKELLLAANLPDENAPADETFAADQAVMRPKIEAILSGLDDSATYADYETLLATMDLSATNGGLISALAQQLADSHVDGVSGRTRDGTVSGEGEDDAT